LAVWNAAVAADALFLSAGSGLERVRRHTGRSCVYAGKKMSGYILSRLLTALNASFLIGDGSLRAKTPTATVVSALSRERVILLSSGLIHADGSRT
jgi:hypothetical protein